MFPSNRVRILVATKPVDFRKGHYGLVAMVQNELRNVPFTGLVFVFCAKRVDRLKVLCRHGTGLVMAHKPLDEATFSWSPIKYGLMAMKHTQLEAIRPSLMGQRPA